jgi:hypothetical protein
MSNSRFITYPIETDSRALMEQAFDFLTINIPGWAPSEGQLDVWMVEAFSSEAADIGTLSTEVPKAIFRFFGSSLFAIPSVEASTALVNTTWHVLDTVGHTIAAGTQFGIRDATGELHAFVVLTDVAIPPGSNQTAVGEVIGTAAIPGAASSDVGVADGPVELIDTFVWIDYVTQSGPSAGGEDAESDDAYLDRLALELQTISPRPILPRDFSILARKVPGVQRATTLDLYDPANNTWNNERMVTVVSIDEDGNPVPSTIRDDVKNYLDAMREINFIVNVMDVIVTGVDVTCNVTILEGYDPVDVVGRVGDTLRNYFDPAKWGIDVNDNPNDPKTWNNINTVYYLEVSSVINLVGGVGRITDLRIGPAGGAQYAADLTLPGVVTLPSPGTFNITYTP